MTGDFTQAILNFEKIENLFPEFDKFVERARFEKSVNLFLQAGKSSEDKKGESYREVNRSFDKFIEDYPESKLVPEVQFWQANSLEETDNLEGALSKYEALKDKYPQKTVIEIKLSRIKDRIKQRQHGTIK
jgi:outer membrane protein assembly factor BamD (BamD/ComL family)